MTVADCEVLLYLCLIDELNSKSRREDIDGPIVNLEVTHLNPYHPDPHRCVVWSNVKILPSKARMGEGEAKKREVTF